MKYFYFLFVLMFTFSVSLAQVNWTKDTLNNPVLVPGPSGSWDDYSLFPFCILFDDSVYHMWYGGHDGTHDRIGYATSMDGISWTKVDSVNPVLDLGGPGEWDDEGVGSPYVIYDGSTYRMWFGGNDGTYTRIGYATSSDGTTWTKYENNPVKDLGPAGSWNAVGVSGPSVYFDGSMFHLWYGGWDAQEYTSIGYATSPDGITWTDHENNPVLVRVNNTWESFHVESPDVFFDGSTYHMWYSGRNTHYWWYWKAGYATSSDGINWTKYADNPVLDKGPAGSWDQSWAAYGRVLFDANSSLYKMWYGGGSGNWNAKLGYATAPVSILHVPGQYETIQDGINAADSGDVVLVDEGTYYENINFKGKAITVASHFWFDSDTSHISNTIIDGSNPSNPDSGSTVCFNSGEDTTSVLCGFTITGGSGLHTASVNMSGGGGITMFSGGKIINNKISGNSVHVTAQHEIGGGGLAFGPSNNTNLIVENNVFTQNSLSGPLNACGGGILLRPRWNDGYVRIKNNLIFSNSVTCTGTYKAIGGGIGISLNLPTKGDIVVEQNIISNNELHCIASVGAGIYVVYWDPGNTITDNNPSPIICSNIISHNHSEGMGGGIGVWTVEHGDHYPGSDIKPQPAIINNTIANNIAQDGCGIFNFDSYPLLMNNIIWDDLSTPSSREIFDENINFAPYVPPYHDPYNDGEVFVHYSDIQDSIWYGEGNIEGNPYFEDSLYNLSDSSCCVGNGVDSLEVEGMWYRCPLTDYNGNVRPHSIDDLVDIGAIESPYEQVPVGIEGLIYDIPMIFELSQNYPNPFNPSTTIEFTLPKSEFVELKIYNILGKEVSTLVSEKLNQGNHTYTFDGKNLASGIYYYRIEAGHFVQTRKMIYLK